MIINPLSNIQLNIQSNSTEKSIESKSNADIKVNENNQKISSLPAGSTVVGQIKGYDDNGNVQISLGEGNEITARLDTSAELPVGSLISFLIKSHDSGSVILSPLLTNTDTASAISKALIQAGIPVNERNSSMVEAMMKEGMAVGKLEVNQMLKSLANTETESIPDAVTCSRLGIEPTADNITQLNAYLGYEHQITEATHEIINLIPSEILSLVADGDSMSALSLTRDLLDIFTGQGALEPVDLETSNLSGLNAPVTDYLSAPDINILTDLLNELGMDSAIQEAISEGQVSTIDVLAVIDEVISSEISPRPEQIQNEIIEEQNIFDGNNNIGQSFLKALSGSNEDALIQNAIKEANEQVFADKTNTLIELIKSKPMNELIKTAVNSEWKLTPEQVETDKQVSELYRRMTEQTERLIDVLNSHSKDDSVLAKEVTNLSNNINFCNELNNMFEYVQLPMRLSQNDAHGELYVYSNKKHMASEDGTVSALLHLDMDHLGATDVYVTMNSSQHVNTHFYLPDDEALDLIASHIDELNERIEKRGYSVSAEFSKREELTNVMQNIISDNKSNIPISISGFDAKA